MTVQIPATARKVVYGLALVAGAIGLVVGIFFPDIAAQATDRITTLGGLVSAAAGVLAYLHLTPDAPKSTAMDVQDDMDAEDTDAPATPDGTADVSTDAVPSDPDQPAAGTQPVQDVA